MLEVGRTGKSACRLEESDEGRMRADWTSHPGAWMGVGRRVRLSFLTAPEVKVDFSFRP